MTECIIVLNKTVDPGPNKVTADPDQGGPEF
jgi:hypothetical protein